MLKITLFILQLDFNYVEDSEPEELRKKCHNNIKLLEKEQPDIILLFKRWLNNLFKTSKEDWEINTTGEQINNLMEVKTMFETALKERDKKMIDNYTNYENIISLYHKEIIF